MRAGERAASDALERALRQVVDPITPHPGPGSPSGRGLKPAAVLVPVILAPGNPELVLTVRNARLNSHPGQISFPGGRVDAEDRDVGHTALREAEEELGIAPRDVELLGSLDLCVTGTGYHVIPVLGLLPGAYPYRPASAEVDEVFHVPLSHVLDDGNHNRVEKEFNGVRRAYYEIWFGKYRIWGATAQMIVDLRKRLESVESRLGQVPKTMGPIAH